MANKETSVGIKLVADLRNYQSNLTKAQKSNKRFASKTKSTMQGLNNTFKNLAVTFGLAFGVSKIQSFLKESIKLYDVQAQAEKQLLVALKGRRIAQQGLIQQARDLQGITLFGDEETIRAQALIAAFVKEEEQIKKVIPLVQDMATAKGMDLAGAADLVSKTLGSSTNALSRYGIQVEGTVGSTERLESLITGLNEAFGGQAEAAAQTGAGALKQLSNAVGDLKEEIGKLLVSGEGFTNWIQGSIAEIQQWSSIISDSNRSTFKNMLLFLTGSRDKWKEVAAEIEAANKQQAEASQAISEYDEMIRKAKLGADQETESKKENTEATQKQVTTYGDLITQISEVNTQLKEADITDTNYIRTLYRKIAALEKQKKAFEDLGKTREMVTAQSVKLDPEKNPDLPGLEMAPVTGGEEGLTDFYNSWDEAMSKREERYREHAEKMRTINEGLKYGFASMGQSVLESLGLANSGFQGFVKGMASTAIDLVSMMLAQSIATSVSNASQSAAATGPAAVFTQPAFMATLIGGVLAAFAKIPKLADGGIAYGDSLVNVGEYSNARVNPEVIAPLDKLQTMINPTGSTVEILQPRVDIDGEKFYIMLQKVGQRINKRT